MHDLLKIWIKIIFEWVKDNVEQRTSYMKHAHWKLSLSFTLWTCTLYASHATRREWHVCMQLPPVYFAYGSGKYSNFSYIINCTIVCCVDFSINSIWDESRWTVWVATVCVVWPTGLNLLSAFLQCHYSTSNSLPAIHNALLTWRLSTP